LAGNKPGGDAASKVFDGGGRKVKVGP
jgi:hypothetical protein